jgi:hypothetical protein
VIHRKHCSQQNYIKITDFVKLNLFITDSEKNATSLTPPSTDFRSTDFSTLKSAGKYNTIQVTLLILYPNPLINTFNLNNHDYLS